MKPNLLIINYFEKALPDLEKSKFFQQADFRNMTEDDHLTSSIAEIPPDIIVVFITKKDDTKCLDKIASIKKNYVDMEIIAAVSEKQTQTGVRALKSGASDFMIFPATPGTFDLYINRAMERTYLHRHLCFNDNCYKSRFARSERNYQQLFDEVPCFIYVQDRDYHITDSNRKFKEFFGEHRGEYCFGICKNRDEPCRECPVDQTLSDGKNHTSESEIISSNGTKYIVLSWTAPIRDPDGEISKVMVMLTDITEIRRLEHHLASLGFMIGSISHGIKGLLTGLDSGMYLLNSGFEKNDRKLLQEGLELSNQMTSRIKKTVLDILYYTKTRKLKLETVSAHAFARDTLLLVRSKAENTGISLIFDGGMTSSDDLITIDPGGLQTAFVNILENAVEACSDNPGDTPHAITLKVRLSKTTVVFLIQDTGPGMDQATLNSIFTIFFSSKGNRGTGLGLYITNKIIELHRGSIKVKASPGEGTKFFIRMPRNISDK